MGSPGVNAIKGQGSLEYTAAMNVIADLCIVPLGVGVALSKYVAACERVIEAAGLSHELHANGTNMEGDWDEVFCVVKRCTKSSTKWASRASIRISSLERGPTEGRR